MKNTLETKTNPFFAREEIKLVVKADKNPSFADAAGMVADEAKANKDNIIIKEVKGKFGRDTFMIKAHVYKNKEDKDKEQVKIDALKNKKSGGKK